MTRQEAIDVLNNKGFTFCNCERCVDFYTALNCEKCDEALNMAIKALEQEPKRGKWIDYTDEGYVECPFCHSATNCEGNIDELKFCFSCGAIMEGEEK